MQCMCAMLLTSQRHAPLSRRGSWGQVRTGQSARVFEGGPAKRKKRAAHFHLLIPVTSKERGVPRDLAQMKRFSKQSSLTNAQVRPRRRQPCIVFFGLISCEPLAMPDDRHHSFLRLYRMVAHLEWSVTAKESIHSVNHLIEEHDVVSQHVLNHSSTVRETMVDTARGATYFVKPASKEATDGTKWCVQESSTTCHTHRVVVCRVVSTTCCAKVVVPCRAVPCRAVSFRVSCQQHVAQRLSCCVVSTTCYAEIVVQCRNDILRIICRVLPCDQHVTKKVSCRVVSVLTTCHRGTTFQISRAVSCHVGRWHIVNTNTRSVWNGSAKLVLPSALQRPTTPAVAPTPDNDNDNDHSYSQLLQQSADLSWGPQCLGRGPVPDWRRKNSLDARHIKQGVPPRSLAAWNKVVLHLCWEGAAFRSGRVCREKSWLLLFGRVSLL